MPTTPTRSDAAPTRLLRIQEVVAETGLTARAIRYYEEIGLLEPAARSDGAYRLFDASDLERLRYIRGLRDDAGFSLAQVRELLEDETTRERNSELFRRTDDPVERRVIITDALARTERRITTLQGKLARVAAMVAEAEARRRHLEGHLAELDSAGEAPAPRPSARLTARPLGAAGAVTSRKDRTKAPPPRRSPR